MATSWQIGTSYHSRYSPFVMTTNSQYGNWFPDGGRGSIGRTPPVSRRTLGTMSMSGGDKHQGLTPVDIQHVVSGTASDPHDRFTSFMAKSGTGRLAAMSDNTAAPLTMAESVMQTRRSTHTPGNSPEPGTMAEYQSGTIGPKAGTNDSKTTQSRDNDVARAKADTRDSRVAKPPGVVDVRPYGQQPSGNATREARIPFNRSKTMVATPVNGTSSEPTAAPREAAPRVMPTLERSHTFHGRPTTPYELVSMRKSDVIPDLYQWSTPEATPPTGATVSTTDAPTYERGRHAGNYKAAAPAGNRAMYWLYGSRGRPGPVAATDYLFSRDALDSQMSGQVPSGPNGSRQYDVKPASGTLESPSRTADARQAAAAASSQAATVNSWTALRSPDTPYVSTVTVNSPRSANVGRVARASGDANLAGARAVASSKMATAEKRSILKRTTSGYDVGTYRASASLFGGDPRLPPLSATPRTASGRKRVTFNL